MICFHLPDLIAMLREQSLVKSQRPNMAHEGHFLCTHVARQRTPAPHWRRLSRRLRFSSTSMALARRVLHMGRRSRHPGRSVGVGLARPLPLCLAALPLGESNLPTSLPPPTRLPCLNLMEPRCVNLMFKAEVGKLESFSSKSEGRIHTKRF